MDTGFVSARSHATPKRRKKSPSGMAPEGQKSCVRSAPSRRVGNDGNDDGDDRGAAGEAGRECRCSEQVHQEAERRVEHLVPVKAGKFKLPWRAVGLNLLGGYKGTAGRRKAKSVMQPVATVAIIATAFRPDFRISESERDSAWVIVRQHHGAAALTVAAAADAIHQ